MISSCLIHLFDCPRTQFARNTCPNCSRIYVKDIIKPSNFKCISHFQCISLFDSAALSKECQDLIKQFNFIVFFDTYQQYQIIISDRKRCLNSYVIQNHIQSVLAFFEIQLRVFVNFFYNLIEYIPKDYQTFFLKNCFTFAHRFIVWSVKEIKVECFQKVFDEIDYNEFNFIKVINNKYIDFCKKKYAN